MREELVSVCTCDFSGLVRGKSFPAADWSSRVQRGVGWVPANVDLACFGGIGESRYGSLGDLVLVPDPDAVLRLALDDGPTAEHFAMGTICTTDGRPWEMCTRAALVSALARLERVSGGLTLRGAFEHEFQFCDGPGCAHEAFSLAGMRAEREFAERVLAAQRAAGITPDTLIREYGPDQFEVTMGPQYGVAIADHAVFIREIVRAVAHSLGRAVTFSPIRSPTSVGNGVHIHLGLQHPDGTPATWDPAGQHKLSPAAGAFVAGVLRHLPSILAFTAPSRVSYLRLTPHRWSAAFNNLGVRDREASLRICPVSTAPGADVARQFHFEYRAADACSSPYLALAAVVHAGAQGIEEGLSAPDATQEDLSQLSPEELSARGLARLPTSLSDALDALEGDTTVAGWLPPDFVSVYACHKRFELSCTEGLDDDAACALYETIY